MDEITAELARRIAALESKVGELYARLDLVEPSSAEAVARSLPDDIADLARAGRRQEAIAALSAVAGISTADAMSRVTAFLRSIGH